MEQFLQQKMHHSHWHTALPGLTVVLALLAAEKVLVVG